MISQQDDSHHSTGMAFSGPKCPTHLGVPVETPHHPTSPDIQLGLSQEARAPTRPQEHVPPATSIPDTAGGQGAEAAGGLLRVRRLRVELEAGGQAALAGGGLGLNHPQLRAKDGRPSPRAKGFERGERNPSQKKEKKEIQVRGSRGGHPPLPHCWHSGLTRQHEPPHQHHVPGVLAHICWWLQRLQQGRGSCLLEQKP